MENMRWLACLLLLVPATARAQRDEPPPWLSDEPPPGLPDGDPLPPLDAAALAGWILAPEPAPSERGEVAEAALEAFFDDHIVEERVQAGDVDGWYGTVGHRLDREFSPDLEAINAERRAGTSLLQQAWDELTRWGEAPSASPEQPGARPITLSATNPTPGSDDLMEAEWNEQLNPLYAPTRDWTVEVRATYGPDGDVLAAWVHRSSGLRSLDGEAVRTVRATPGPPPPDGVLGARTALRADWRFTAMEPAPLFNLGMVPGLALGGALFLDIASRMTMLLVHQLIDLVGEALADDTVCEEMIVPGCSGARSRIELLRVVDATHLTPEERRAAR